MLSVSTRETESVEPECCSKSFYVEDPVSLCREFTWFTAIHCLCAFAMNLGLLCSPPLSTLRAGQFLHHCPFKSVAVQLGKNCHKVGKFKVTS